MFVATAITKEKAYQHGRSETVIGFSTRVKAAIMLKCDRCHNEVTLGQWADDLCPIRRIFFDQPKIYHTVTGLSSTPGEEQLREAFQRDRMEASYARTQP